ncbi:hypothetical protein [Myxosarcina sp. GI1]|uniref:hypothetical protein n=1 Tax=Myxosarcina sp. GI1 TaxID=1541065 RepID=UPI00056344F1|nr:hypothetical protein [Myxosarcina sp. GI1]
MIDDVQKSETECPKCGYYLVWQQCQVIDCNEGYIKDDDPFWDSEIQICEDCQGTGYLEWCQNCGYGCN